MQFSWVRHDLPGFIVLGLIAAYCLYQPSLGEGNSVKIALLYSRTGKFASDDLPVLDALLLAVDEINARGGLFGHPLKPFIYDGHSDAQVYQQQIAQLIDADEMNALFIGSNADLIAPSATMLENAPFFVGDSSHWQMYLHPNAMQSGLTIEQQLAPAIAYASIHVGHTFCLIHENEKQAQQTEEMCQKNGVELIKTFSFKDDAHLENIVLELEAMAPDVALIALNADHSAALFATLARHQEIQKSKTSYFYFTISERLQDMLRHTCYPHSYLVTSYHQLIDTAVNKKFIDRFKTKYGAERIINSAMESAYSAILLWHQAALRAESLERATIIKKLAGSSMLIPEGTMIIDQSTLQAWHPIRIVQCTKEGATIIYESQQPLPPTHCLKKTGAVIG